jgi:hypothetical protein
MTRQIRATFAVLVLAQAAHSTEEYLGRLWEALLPPRVVSLVFSSDPQRGFLIANLLIVALGVWCLAWPVRRDWHIAPALVWGWAVVEIGNGILHPLATLVFQRYIAGVLTAPLLLAVALRLVYLLRQRTPVARHDP